MKSVVLLVLVGLLGTNAQILNVVELARSLGATTLVSYLEVTGLNSTLATTGGGNAYTVFGPSNAAFANLPDDVRNSLSNVTVLTDVLKYHVIGGGIAYSSSLINGQLVQSLNEKNIRINIYTPPAGKIITASGSPVSVADQNATNGVIHVVDKVMLPPAGNVVDIVSSTAIFSTLLTAVNTAEMASVLAGGPFTVFAPTNAAFSGVSNLDELLQDKEKLKKILQYHVVSDAVLYSYGLTNGATVNTLADQMVTVTIANNIVKVNDATVTSPDLTVTNGVIHTIDKVLIPDLTGSGSISVVGRVSVLVAVLLGLFLH